MNGISNKRLSNRVIWGLEDIIARLLSAEEELEIAQKRAEYFFDPVTLILVRRALAHTKIAIAIAQDTRNLPNEKSPSIETGSDDNSLPQDQLSSRMIT